MKEKWQKIIKEWEIETKYNNISQAGFCAKRKLASSQFYYWSSKLKKENCQYRPVIADVPKQSNYEKLSTNFITIETKDIITNDCISSSSLEIKLPNGIIINGINEKTLINFMPILLNAGVKPC